MTDYTKNPSEEMLKKTIKNLESRNFEVNLVENGKDALDMIKVILKDGGEVMSASSTTLSEIGFEAFVNENPNGNIIDIKSKIWSINDPVERSNERRKASSAEYLFGGLNAITEDGQLVAVDASGSRVSAYAFAAKKVVLIVSIDKIVENLDEAMKRVREYVFPREDERALSAYGVGSSMNKWLIIEKEAEKGRVAIILIKEKLGF